MENSVVYQGYRKCKEIYLNSKVVDFFALLLPRLFKILVASKVFLAASHPIYGLIFEKSIIFNGGCKFARIMRRILGLDIVKRSVRNSFFVGFIINAMEKKNKAVINQLYLILIITLLVNMGIKALMGSFHFIGNKQLIFALFILSALYSLQLDYGIILKNSKVVAIAQGILYDERAKHHI